MNRLAFRPWRFLQRNRQKGAFIRQISTYLIGSWILLMALGTQSSLYGQNYSDTWGPVAPLGTHNAANSGSDYQVVITWSGVTTSASSGNFNSPCDCNDGGLGRIEYGTVQGKNNRNAIFAKNNPGGNSNMTVTVGPSYNQALHLYGEWDGQNDFIVNCVEDCDQTAWSTSGTLSIRTAALKNPTNFQASTDINSGSELDKITLTWDKGTDLPTADIGYRVYRNVNGNWVLLATLTGSDETYTDQGLSASTSYQYRIVTYTNTFGGHTSSGVNDWGATVNPSVEATDGDYKNRVKLTWTNLASVVDNIRVERSEPNSTTGFEELSILNKNATSYNDYDPIPGSPYTYRVTFLDDNGNDIESFTDWGHMKPNGVIKGRVTSLGGAGVQNVTITIALENPLTGSASPATGVSSGPWTQQTDVAGYYEIRNIYYHDSATFVITPSYPNHGFDPEELTRILELNTTQQGGVDFIDTTALTVSGTVAFQDNNLFSLPGGSMSGTGLRVEGAKILVDDQDYGIRTDQDGIWSYAVPDSDVYEFKVEYSDHTFAVDSQTLNIGQDTYGIDFLDMETDSVQILVQGGCQSSVSIPASEPLTVRVVGTVPGTFDATYLTNNDGFLELPLPATAFTIDVQNVDIDPNAYFQYQDTTISIDMTGRDSSETVVEDTVYTIIEPDTIVNDGVVTYLPGDTTYTVESDTLTEFVQASAEFIYYRPLAIDIDFDLAGADVLASCLDPVNEPIVLMEQGVKYSVQIEVHEIGTGCPVEEGSVLIYDFISDLETSPTSVPIVNGQAFYDIIAATPNLASGGNHEYQKLLYLKASAGVRDPQAEDYWAIVEGAAQLAATFSTRSPELPDLVVHDPPGDASYATVEQGYELTTFSSDSYEISGSGGIYSDQTFGTSIKTPFSENNLGIQWKFNIDAGRDNFNTTGYSTTLTFTDAFSTSDDALFTGYDGDVYIGKATNQQFAIAKVLTYDEAQCSTDVSDEPIFYPTGIATTFVYSEKHIRDILIPQLAYLEETLRDVASGLTGTDSLEKIHEADSFKIDILNWQEVLNENAKNRDEDAVPIIKDGQPYNVSFSAGAAIDRTEVMDTVYSGTYEYTSFVDISTTIGGKFEVKTGVWSDNTIGIAAKFRHSYTSVTDNDTTISRTISYHLEDDDFGDFFSVDILRDPAFDVPAFRIFSGTSSCPREPGTQPRDSASLTITPPEIFNVPIGGQAVFTANLTNYSNSQETREYHVRVVSNTNPDGAIIKLNGQLINHKEASFFINAFETANAYLTVEKGPLASEYANIGIMMYPPCEYELWENNGAITMGDTAWISVSFETECSDVTLVEPTDGWLVNQASNDELAINFSGYDLNNPYLESLTLQYREPGDTWVDAFTVSIDSIVDNIYYAPFDVGNLPNGTYGVRAMSQCTDGRGVAYSDEVVGTIDRNSVAPFGTPSPSNGFLRFGEEISITFDKPIDCDLANYMTDSLSLIRGDDSTEISFTVQCAGNTIILVPDNDLFSDSTLEDVIIHAYVSGIMDLSGNVQEYAASWAFEVNVSPVFWDPAAIVSSVLTGDELIITGTLKNQSNLSHDFEITEYPVWLIPGSTTGTVLSNGTYDIDFLVDSYLDPGIYEGVVKAIVDDAVVELDVTVSILAIPPAWTVDPGLYDYSMTMVLQFSLDNGNTQLSTDTRDMIAAFVNGERRGSGQIEYIEDLDIYAAFITVYSNNANPATPDTINFRYWQAVDGSEYGAIERPVFANDATLGTISSPYILHPEGIVQIIPMTPGWNWISFNVEATEMSTQAVFQSLTSESIGNDILVKQKDGQSAFYTRATGWIGSLTAVDNSNGYLVHLSDEPDTLQVVGTPITPYGFNVAQGWSWIGYQPQRTKTTSEALTSISPESGDIVKSQQGFDEYFEDTESWYGSLKFMQPGSAYKLLLSRQALLTYPARLANSDLESQYTVQDEYFESNMTVIAKIGFEEFDQVDADRFIVGAFVEDSCHGVGYLQYVEEFGEYRIFLPVHGNLSMQGKTVTFRLYDRELGIEYRSESVSPFAVDLIQGELEDPFVLFHSLNIRGELYLHQNEPNPFGESTDIRFFVKDPGHVNLTVYDATGRIIEVLVDEELQDGLHRVTFNAGDLAAGMYIYRLVQDEQDLIRKMIILGQ
ncbi:T9SS type A sorting domain-containing protein [Pontibacter sp. G13]|uniref:T9SS type A sorting domain-containing protein n=1 Tax=Pontibacter sp. G13 TaxID=3074898 RepID=UPI00288C48FE|nr:T9SS type A sorting domain-containing protein [Pontibacter sp. G13]WNJ17515.1 T9SS type A sorting domain-containing protein [Pontibacter sp. G13]